MGTTNRSSAKSGTQKSGAGNKNSKKKNSMTPIMIVTAIIFIGIFTFAALSSGNKGGKAGAGSQTDLTINKSEVTSTAVFYPYRSGSTDMEVVAVRASDGTVRTAFNTCQVCYASGRGFYKQQGDELVCQNCGNRFKLDQVEKIKGGCNPVPIMKQDKTETDSTITVSKEYLDSNKSLFYKWKKV